MFKYDKINVFISYRNKTHYLKLGYNAILNEELEIDINHLSKSSHVKIDVICSLCNSESKLMYYKYVKNVNRHGFYGCKKCSRQKAALTSIDRYGVDNYSKTSDWKIKVERTNMIKFGYKTNLISPEYKSRIKKTLFNIYGTENFWEIRDKNSISKKLKLIDIDKIQKTILIDSENLYKKITDTDYILYRNECRRLTKKNILKLLEKWDGKDYYDNSDISNNFNLKHNDTEYPTIDHKISVYYGFINKIDPILIGSIDNLCITKRSINSKKRDLCEIEFKSFYTI
jgi:hypothetical protein